MSRAIGDRMLKHLVVGEPDVQSRRPLAKDRFIVLASDGLWDILSNEEVGRIVQETTAAGDDPQVRTTAVVRRCQSLNSIIEFKNLEDIQKNYGRSLSSRKYG